jgi:hypothetical protein
MEALGRQLLRATGDTREVVTNVHTRYFGAEIDDPALRPDAATRPGPMHFEEWLVENKAR